MRLNLSVIAEEMDVPDENTHISSAPFQNKVTHAEYCPSVPRHPDASVLYLLPSDAEPEGYCCSEPLSLFFTEKPSEQWTETSCEYIWPARHIDPVELLSQINRIFFKYENWENECRDVVDKHLPIKEFAYLTFPLEKNPIYLQTTGYHVPFYYMPDVPDAPDSYENYRKSFHIADNSNVSPEDINLLISDPRYLEADQYTEPEIFSSSTFDFRSLYYNVRVDGILIARICFDEVLQPISPSSYLVIKEMGYYISQYLSSENAFQFNRPYELDYILRNLIQHHLLPESEIQTLLDTFHWQMNDTYICMNLQLKTKKETRSTLEPLILSLSGYLDAQCYTVLDNNIIIVYNLTQNHEDTDSLLHRILPILRDNLLTAWISSPYHDFKNIYYYYCFAVQAGQIASREDPTNWYVRADAYSLKCIISKSKKGTLAEVMIPENLKAIITYDQKHNTDYCKLLKIYLLHERNIAETSRAAYLHRNTCLYRLKRIEELLQLNLDDADVRFMLLFSFYLLG